MPGFDLTAALELFLRPVGGGLHTVSTGRAAQQALQREYYGVATDAAVAPAWRADLDRLGAARVAILGIPSDSGAGLVRGTAYGPLALRQAWLHAQPGLRGYFDGHAVVDLGDVFCVPHFLADDMLSDAQKDASRAVLYPGTSDGARAALPVAPLSIAEHVLGLVLARKPDLRVLILGGDHSVAWPVVAALATAAGPPVGVPPFGIVQLDAHTDLLAERLGVKTCFATWAYHANLRLGRNGALVQVGVRASGRDRDHWESTLGVRQLRAEDVLGREAAVVADEIAAHFALRGIKRIYLTNDIDGTDGVLAPATGAPEPGGLEPDWVVDFIAALGRSLDVVAADLVEVAPPVGGESGSQRTLAIGARYLAQSLAVLLGNQGEPNP